MTGFEMCNKYQIKNSLGQLVYFATEGSSQLQLTSHILASIASTASSARCGQFICISCCNMVYVWLCLCGVGKTYKDCYSLSCGRLKSKHRGLANAYLYLFRWCKMGLFSSAYENVICRIIALHNNNITCYFSEITAFYWDEHPTYCKHDNVK